MASANNYIINVLVFNTDKSENTIDEKRREKEITGFLASLSPKPDVLLLQEVKEIKDPKTGETIDQRKYIKEAIDGGEENYFDIEQEERPFYYFYNNALNKPFNMIMYNKTKLKRTRIFTLDTTNCDPEFNPDPERFCYGRFKIMGENFLIVSFHGHWKLREGFGKELKTNPKFEKIKKEDRVAAIRWFLLKNYLQCFHDLKLKMNCQFMLVGGDFNVDMDDFQEKEEIGILGKLRLKTIQYQNQRKRGKITPDDIKLKRKIDTLVCDQVLKDVEVRTYVTKDYAIKKDEDKKCVKEQLNSLVIQAKIDDKTLDHHPILCTLEFSPSLEDSPTFALDDARQIEKLTRKLLKLRT